jgi:hypothetical protein
MDFKELADERRRVRDLCRKHLPSLATFKFAKGASFKLFWDEPEEPSGGEVRHLTTTATCIESLQGCHPIFRCPSGLQKIAESVGANPDCGEEILNALGRAFYSEALKRKCWTSEASAPVYCASRAMPLFLEETTTEWTQKHRALVATIYKQLRQPDRFGIGEKTKASKKRSPPWYPENAYHTYWGLVVLRILRGRFATQGREATGLDLERMWESMRLWVKARLAEEVGLHWARSAALDSDQLTWALAAFIEFEQDLSSTLRSQDLVRKAFDALASTQEKIGAWRHYRPLFVYSNVGNAYCYVYESFTFLLKAVLKKFEQEEFLEKVLRDFIDRLRRLRQYAEMTQVQHLCEPDAVAWSSGHRPADPKPEGWATASVFSYLQAYRRLLGVLARRDALRELPGPVLAKDPNALRTLAERGDTWTPPRRKNSVAEDLVTLFVNPVRMAPEPDLSEPDDQPIAERQARSAILFGPPGASKTTLARSVASALGWKYVELHSSHFVADGIQAVQRTADRIFGYLMELDHTIVLFDEPDELVREREGTPDAFGRFLTTSMLPKLAELWKQRRIIYFVATNHIRYFDAAIIRSERVDVLVFVPLPSFAKKADELRKRLKALRGTEAHLEVAQNEIDETLKGLGGYRRVHPSTEARLPGEAQLAKLILLRWDQLDELVLILARHSVPGTPLALDAQCLSDALRDIEDRRLSQLQTYLDYLDDLDYVRKDFQRKPVFSVRNLTQDDPLPPMVERTASGFWLPCESGECPDTLPGYKVLRTGTPGEVEIVPA